VAYSGLTVTLLQREEGFAWCLQAHGGTRKHPTGPMPTQGCPQLAPGSEEGEDTQFLCGWRIGPNSRAGSMSSDTRSGAQRDKGWTGGVMQRRSMKGHEVGEGEAGVEAYSRKRRQGKRRKRNN